MRRYWPMIVIVAAFGALGLANVLRSPAVAGLAATDAQANLDAVPLTIGSWVGTVQTIPEKQLKVAEAQASLSRLYRRTDTGATVQVMVLYGGPGPLGAHTPEVCYQGAGFKQLGQAKRKPIPQRSAEFWHGEFERGDLGTSVLNVYWGWGTDGTWKASEYARFDFANHAAIYKLYASWAVPTARDAAAKPANPLDEFLPPFLDDLERLTRGDGNRKAL